MTAWLSNFLGDWRRRKSNKPVRTQVQLAEFLSRQAAFVAQKCTDGYCRAKVGVAIHALGEEKAFKDANAICRWEGYAEMLAAMSALTGRALVAAGAEPATVDRVLHDMYARVLNGHSRPAHRPDGWGDLIAALPARLAAARTEPQPRLAEIAGAAGRRLFEVLPIHARHRELDEEIVVNSVTFNFVGYSDKFRRQVDVPAIADAMMSDVAGAQGGMAPTPRRA